MHTHLQFALADYLMSTFMLKTGGEDHANEENLKIDSIIDANEHLFSDIVSPNSRSSA